MDLTLKGLEGWVEAGLVEAKEGSRGRGRVGQFEEFGK